MNDVSLQTIAMLAVRHAATVAGGWLIHKGYLDASGNEAFIGAAMTIGGVECFPVWKGSNQQRRLFRKSPNERIFVAGGFFLLYQCGAAAGLDPAG